MQRIGFVAVLGSAFACTVIAVDTTSVSISVAPQTASVQTGLTQQFSASVSGSTDAAASWALQEASGCGSVSTSGLYTAPATVPATATCHIVATAHADGAKTAVAIVNVTAQVVGSTTLPALHVASGALRDPHENRVILRGLSTMGMAMVYGDKANPGTYVPMTPAQYVGRAVQTDATGSKWYSTAIRLVFERFPCVNPGRLYQTENVPYAMPDTVAFDPWAANTQYLEGTVAASGGTRYRALKRTWRADHGQSWNPGQYAVGDVLSGYGGGNDYHLYRCTFASNAGPTSNWGGGPSGTDAVNPVTDAMGNKWVYVGEFGRSGSTQPFGGATINDYSVGGDVYPDHFVWWQRVSADYPPDQAAANFNEWKSKVMDPAIQAGVLNGLYVVVTDFDFGPAHHPLRHKRMLDFWQRMAASQWANHPQVLFELWNESEDIGSYSGGPGSWVQQKPVIQETVNAIRAAGANNVVIVPTPFYSAWVGEATASPLTGANLAYALHMYRSQWEAYSSNRDQVTQAMSTGQALMMTEWGDDTNPSTPAAAWPTTATPSPSLRQLLEPSEGAAHGASGWFAWSLSTNWSPGMFSNSSLTQPNNFAIATRQWLSDKRSDSQPVP